MSVLQMLLCLCKNVTVSSTKGGGMGLFGSLTLCTVCSSELLPLANSAGLCLECARTYCTFVSFYASLLSKASAPVVVKTK